MKAKDKLQLYLDAGFPLIYINSFEEEKVDDIIKKSVGGRRILEWDEMHRYRDLKTGEIINSEYTIREVLMMGIQYGELNRILIFPPSCRRLCWKQRSEGESHLCDAPGEGRACCRKTQLQFCDSRG